ncbi:MAG: sensor histidine kinase [Verrucomicrobiae bacterium]|nr:sensor histidine kinase [Verrucomicrobiae bacterium]
MSARPTHLRNPAIICLVACLAGPALAQAPVPTVLTNASQIRNLAVAEAARAMPVHLQGVVLADSAGGNSLVIQDESEAIYLTGSPSAVSRYHRGDLVEITGVTDPGGFAPIVTIRNAKKTGTAPLPEPRRVIFDDLMRKHYDAQYVEISGVVRSCEPASDPNDVRTKMVVETGGERLAVRLHARLPAGSLVDAEVRLRGICFSRYTASRQFLTPLLDIPRGVEPHVEKPAPKNPWDTPLISGVDLLQFAPERDYGHRVRVHGIVTSQQPGTIWLRDGGHGLRAFSSQNIHLQPGDVVDALGFPNTQGNYSPVIDDAIFRKITNASPPLPVLVTNLTAAVHQDAGLIQLEAKLNAKRPVEGGWALTLGWEGKVIEAQIFLTNGMSLPAEWQPGSRILVAGICSVSAAPADTALSGVWEPVSFSLLIRSPADLTVLQSPPWWTPAHVIRILGAVIGGLLLVTGVVALMARRRLNEQERQRAMAEAEFTAILTERNRMAREIHDTLAQGLVATSVQLRLAKKTSVSSPESLVQHIDAAQQLVRSSLEESRKSIWNMRSQVLETGDLAGALQGILKQMADGSELKTAFDVIGQARRLAPVIEGNLLRVGQEAITNAAKHARAKNLMVRLEFGEKQFCLVVTDDGRGFDPASPPPSDGGFGLMGMRERAAELKGELHVRSSPGQGAEIKFTVPLTGD